MQEELSRVKLNHAEIKISETKTERLAIFMYNGNYDPKPILDRAVSIYVEANGYHQFIDIEKDNPWVRVIISDVNSIPQKDFNPETDRINAPI
ncbi:MAG: hypothetical protein WED10_06435 [Brumimicrobium sp.]